MGPNLRKALWALLEPALTESQQLAVVLLVNTFAVKSVSELALVERRLVYDRIKLAMRVYRVEAGVADQVRAKALKVLGLKSEPRPASMTAAALRSRSSSAP